MLDFAKEKYHYLLKKQEDAAKSWYEERGKEYLSEDKRRSLPDEEKPPRTLGLAQLSRAGSRFAGRTTGFGPADSNATNPSLSQSTMGPCPSP